MVSLSPSKYLTTADNTNILKNRQSQSINKNEKHESSINYLTKSLTKESSKTNIDLISWKNKDEMKSSDSNNKNNIHNDEDSKEQTLQNHSMNLERANSSKSEPLDAIERLTKRTSIAERPSDQKSSSLNVTPSILSSNSCSSSLSTSSASSSASSSSTTSSTSYLTSSSAVTTFTKTVDNSKSNIDPTSLSRPSKVMQNKSDFVVSIDEPESTFSNELSESGHHSDSTNEYTNLMSVSGESPSSFRRSNFGGSFRESSYKKQKENYLSEKKRITNDMLSIMREESIIVLADWLKIRGSLKNWVKVYAVLKPGIMLLYKSEKMKPGQWIGTIILNSCQLLERPSKKHGFCFKLFHPMEKSIWASKGPVGETYINVPYMLLPTFYLIFRASSEKIGQIWMDAIELTLRSSHLLKPTNSLSTPYNTQLSKANSAEIHSSSNNTISKTQNSENSSDNTNAQENVFPNFILNGSLSPNLNVKRLNITKSMSSLNSNEIHSKKCLIANQQDIEIEKNHFTSILSDQHDDNVQSDSDGAKNSSEDICSLNSSNNDEFFENSFKENQLLCNENESDTSADNSDQTIYQISPREEFGELGNKGQTEEVDEEDKSLIFCLVKQVRPGMDLSKVVLPTFILEPRSFLEKLTDFYYHSDILSEAITNDDPCERMKTILKFYLSGFYKKPKGLKKPYNPILGEVFRSYWYNPKTDSKTFYIAEQVSHHPPITSIYVSNRKEGFCIYGTILARSKFYGNSVSAIMEGQVKLILLNRGEEYVISLPYANCKGILLGKLTMELGGKISIDCVKTGYSAEIEFKLKPLLGGIEASNLIDGKIKFAKETIASISGKWDGEIILNEKREQKQCLLWNPTKQVIDSRLKRYIVSIDKQNEFESELLWNKVSNAIKICDQHLATEEKSIIEFKQRENNTERKAKLIEYVPKFFTYDRENKEWLYNYSDLRPWDTQTDLFQYEQNFKISTKTKHKVSKLKNKKFVRPSITSIISHNSSSHMINSNIVTKKTSNNESSIDVIIQYTEIKNRLEVIEENLKKLTINFDRCSNYKHYDVTTDNEITQKKVHGYTNLSFIPSSFEDVKKILTSRDFLMVFVAWFIGILSAFFSKRFF